MSLVFRTSQSVPLTNDQLDGNFSYLNDQIALKYNTADFTASAISTKLALASSQANGLNSWTIRGLVPDSALPSDSDKSSVVSRNSSGNFTANIITASLSGNASTATLASAATTLATARQINGVSFDGSANITVADSTKLPLAGGTMTGKLVLQPSATSGASINFGTSNNVPTSPVDGDAWATTSGLFCKISGQTEQLAVLNSPTFTGIPRVPGYSGEASQIAALSHLDNATTTLNSAISLKAPIASPAFTGVPTAATASAGTNSTQLATTAFVKTAVDSKASDLTNSYQTYTTNAIITQSNASNAALAAAVAALNASIAATRPVPAGAVFYTASTIVPTGYLEANGGAVSRTTYSDLWQALGSPNTGDGSTTFNLPDLRGEFVRGWDHGRGVDVDRTLLSWQEDQFKSHHHSVYVMAPGGGYAAYSNVAGPRTVDTSDVGGIETRPRNIALMPIIKW